MQSFILSFLCNNCVVVFSQLAKDKTASISQTVVIKFELASLSEVNSTFLQKLHYVVLSLRKNVCVK